MRKRRKIKIKKRVDLLYKLKYEPSDKSPEGFFHILYLLIMEHEKKDGIERHTE